ncbi:MAG: head GIN domain-containing protein [Anaerolineales bacterium]|jgi:hypothetical protein
MNKRIYVPAIILLVALLASGCGLQMVSGSGRIVTETHNISGFSSVTLAGIGNVYITQGPAESLRIEAEDNLIPYFDTSVQDGTLKIGIKAEYMGVSLLPTRPVNFYVTLPKIAAITLAGSGNIFAGNLQAGAFGISLLGSGNIAANALAVTDLDLRLGGSGNISLGTVSASQVNANIGGSGDIHVDELTADKISSKTAGSGNITICGKVAEQSAEILGSGDYLAGGLKSATASLRITGSGNSQVSSSGTLNVTILGSGDVAYSGNPTVNASIACSGKGDQANQ